MSDEPLTYRASGVDVNVNNEANERIKRHVRRTRNGRVVTEPGLFSGGVSLKDFQGAAAPALVGSLGQGRDAGAIVAACRRGLPAAAEPVAFLDYLAASRLDASAVERWVGAFADELTRGTNGTGIPLVGGETAEMPGVFRPGAWEVVGALYGVAGAPAGAGAGAADLAAIRGMRDPVLMLSMDGVGTKVKLGVTLRRTWGFAFDIVGHSLNDILCQGARGLGMSIYFGCHTRDEELIGAFEEGVEECLKREGLALLDLAVSEDPRVYREGEIDICASIAGLLDRERLVTGAAIARDDLAIGLASDGLHTNGYSLARKALLERGGLSLGERIPELGDELGRVLLAPHRPYARAVLPLLEGGDPPVRGIAHITGGGLPDNIVRILPPGLGVEIRRSAWPVPPLFPLIQRCGNIPDTDPQGKGMYETFNMGIGMVLFVPPSRAEDVLRAMAGSGERAWIIGRVGDTAPKTAPGSSDRAGRRVNGTAPGAAPHERVRLIP